MLIPEVPELLPGEDERIVPHRGDWVRLSVAPPLTEDFLARLLALLVVYAAARNFVVTEGSFRRLAWVGFASGVLLALLGASQLLAGSRLQLFPPPDAGGPAFGTFRNKNHFAFQVNLFAGLGIGLFLRAARREGVWSPQALGLLAGLGLMFASVAFSQSRGGVVAVVVAAMLTAAVARWGGRSEPDPRVRRAVLALAAGAGMLALGLVATLGWRVVTDRLATLWDGAADDRAAGWRGVWPLVKAFPVTGVGGGGLARAEPVVRTRSDWRTEFNTLDNDYLEALVEGGPVRLALTVGLAVAAVGAAVNGYRRGRSRGLGAMSLGCVFGLGAVAVHSAGDYGLHIPSVAVAAAVIAGHVTGVRRRDETKVSEPAVVGSGVYVAAGVILLAGLVVALAEWRMARVDRMRRSAAAVLRSSDPNRWDSAVRYLEAATRIRPDDPVPWNELLAAHLGAAGERWRTAAFAVAGPVVFARPADVPTGGADPDGHTSAALRAARAVRDLQPLYSGPHLVLASYGSLFARTEPAAVHLARAKRVASFDPEVWYVCGLISDDRGDLSAALGDWRESLARSDRRLGPIARRLAGRLPPERVRGEVLPDDPEVWQAATPFLFPDAAPTDPDRLAWLRAAADRWAAGPEPDTPARFAAWASLLEELADDPAALRVWRRAAERFPDDVPTRDRLAARLEAEESYGEAVPVLEWLTARRPGDVGLIDRLDAARHALALKAEIDRP